MKKQCTIIEMAEKSYIVFNKGELLLNVHNSILVSREQHDRISMKIADTASVDSNRATHHTLSGFGNKSSIEMNNIKHRYTITHAVLLMLYNTLAAQYTCKQRYTRLHC